MPQGFTIGDAIRKARKMRKWNQARLGKEAAKFRLGAGEGNINKSTVSKVETAPYTSKLGTVWRLLATLDLRFTDIERATETPFAITSVDAIGKAGVPGQAPSGRHKRAG